MAQDFRAAFKLGKDDKHISTVDADGVALAAIQALYRLSQRTDEQIRELEAQLQQLQAELAVIKAKLTQGGDVQTAELESREQARSPGTR